MITTEVEILRNQAAKQRAIQAVQDRFNDAANRLYILAVKGLKSPSAVANYENAEKELREAKS